MPERFRLKPKNSDELKKSWQLILDQLPIWSISKAMLSIT